MKNKTEVGAAVVFIFIVMLVAWGISLQYDLGEKCLNAGYHGYDAHVGQCYTKNYYPLPRSDNGK